MVLLHGWGASGRVWDALVDRLKDRVRLLPIDLPGYGDAMGSTDGYDLDDITARLVKDQPGSIWWLGWSLGGLIALNAAYRFADRVAGLILVATTPCFTTRPGWPNAVDPELLQGFQDQVQSAPAQTLRRFNTLQARDGEQSKSVIRTLRLASQWLPDTATLAGGLRILAGTDLRATTAKIRCPVLLIFGERDPLVPATIAGPVTGMFADARHHVIAGASHAPFLSHPQTMAQHIAEFLDGR